MFEQFDIPGIQPWAHLIWLVPILLLVCGWGIAKRDATLRIFAYDPVRSAEWLKALKRRRWRKAILLACAIVFLTSAAVQPRCNPKQQTYKTSSRDIAVLLDVSRSMLATDLQPNRLERAKDELSRLADRLRGDRIGLVVFSGDAVIKCPLTRNYSYFKSTLHNVTTRSASTGGTSIGDAIHKALSDLLGVDTGDHPPADENTEVGETVMEDEMRGRKETYADILLITDGEDHNSYPIHASKRAAQFNVGLYSVGLGDEDGSPIPIDDGGKTEFLKNREGEVVISRLDAKTLIEMTNNAPRGAFLPVGTQNFDLSEFYSESIAKDSRREIVEKQVFWTEIYQPFLFAGIFFYLLHLLLQERPRTGQLAIENEGGGA